MRSKELENILEKYCNHEKGILLFDAPTGVGKTTAAIKYIKKFLNGDLNIDKEKIIYLTNLKTNLPIKALKSQIGEEAFNKECLVLKPYYDIIIDNYDLFINCQFDDIKKLKEYKNLKVKLKYEKKIEEKIKKEGLENYYEELKQLIQSIQLNEEPAFRKRIKNYLFNDAIENIKKINWVKQLYNYLDILDKKIIMLTTSKFFSPLDLFEKGSEYLYLNNNLINKALILIDEFDSTKEVILNNIIDNGIKYSQDLISLFTNINNSLRNNILSENFKKIIMTHDFRKNPFDTLEINKKLFSDIYTKYGLDFVIKSNNMIEKKNFIFLDENRFYYSSGYLLLEKDNNKKELIIRKGKKKEIDDIKIFSLRNFVYDVVYAINHFIKGIKWFSYNFMNSYNDEFKDKLKKISLEEAIKSVLSYFRFPNEQVEYLYTKIINEKNYENSDIKNKNKNFFEDGFSYIILKDSYKHILNTKLNYFDFNTTPEQIIFNLANETFVVALSATATIDTTIGNYNLSHLKIRIGNNFFVLDDEDKDIIKNKLEEKEILYKQGKSSIILDYLEEHSEEYYDDIIENLIYCCKKMIENNIQSFVCFLNSFSLKNLEAINFKKFLYEKTGIDNIEISILKSENFESEFELIKKNLKEGKKVFIWTTYSTIGTGKNIQYEIPLKYSNHETFDETKLIEKDFEGIYLCKPTHLLENIINIETLSFDEINMKIAKAMYQINYLYKNGNIDYINKNTYLINLLKCLEENKSFYLPITFDFIMNLAIYSIQAIGRICRTSNKSKMVNILIDKNLGDDLSQLKDTLDSRLYNKEFIKLLEYKNLKVFEYNEYNEVDKKAANYIKDLCRFNGWNNEKVKKWKELRLFVLTNPTSNGYNYSKDNFLQFYYHFDKEVCGYTLNRDEKYNKNINIKLLYNNKKYKSYSCKKIVSETWANLDKLMQYKPLKDFFIKQKYAIRFEKNKFIMCQTLFTSIYMGAIGEVCGKFILDNRLENSLEEMPIEKYELFDFKYGNYYFDFKNWNTFRADRKKYIEKIINHLDQLNGIKAFIVNVYSEEYIDVVSENPRIIEVPSLLYRDMKLNIVKVNDKAINEIINHLED